jgi:peptide/nickel transport system substrate-binding protein
MSPEHPPLSAVRRSRDELDNHLIDELEAGRLSRREFVRRATVLGFSVPVIGAVLAACGGANSTGASSAQTTKAGRAGATIRAGIIAPTASINPLTVTDQGGQDMLAQTGEYLCLADQQLALRPVLAQSWSHNDDATVWTFQLRRGVSFHDGRPMTADDVVYTYRLQCDPKNAANALSAFIGFLVPDGVRKIDQHTVAFHLKAPNGAFPYLCSSDNYNMIILPKGYDPGDWQKSFIGTGPFVLEAYNQGQGATFTRNPHYWGRPALPAKTEFTFYSDQTPLLLALQGGTVDVVGQFTVVGGESILNNSSFHVINLKASSHRELSMRTDLAPFNDSRVRRAIALTINRPGLVKDLLQGYAQLGNDSPFAPIFASTNTSVAQRQQDLAEAKQLLAAAGHPDGFKTKLWTEQLQEIPLYAQTIKADAAKIGVTIDLDIETSAAYYGKATFGNSDWLDGTMSLADYGHRSVPNVLLEAPLVSHGSWNAARFNDPTYNRLVQQFVATSDLQSQRQVAGKIQTLLLEQTPIIYAYFYDYLTATTSNVTGVYPTQIGHLFLQQAAQT